jgi:hypothetical protein
MIINFNGSREDLDKVVRAAMLAMAEPAIKRYQQDGNLENLCNELGCPVPAAPTATTPSVADQLKALFGSEIEMVKTSE